MVRASDAISDAALRAALICEDCRLKWSHALSSTVPFRCRSRCLACCVVGRLRGAVGVGCTANCHSLDVAEAIAAFGEPGDLLGSSGGEGASATATAIPRKTTTGAASPSVRTSPPAAEPSSQDRAPQDEPVFPDPPDEVPESMEWALYGPYPTMQTCEQAQAAWPSGTTECFIVDGQNYYHGMRQAFR